MTSLELIKLLQACGHKHNKKIFTLREVALLGNETEADVGMALLRAKKKGIVGHVQNLWFNLMEPPTIEELALALKTPSYISFESALYKHGVLSQSPRGLLSVAIRTRPAKLTTPLGDIQFIHLSPKLFFGFDAQRIAFPEKALLDLIYIRIRLGQPEIPEKIYPDLLNKRRLNAFSNKYPVYVKKKLLKI